MTERVVRTAGLAKRFGAITTLEDLALEVRPGEVFGYLGPNGAGKTTTIRLLLDFIRQIRGDYWLFGRPEAFAICADSRSTTSM